MKNIYYEKKYYAWQKKAGLYGSQQDLWMYEKFIKSTDSVLDFGCGGGFMLARLRCKHKFGIDINSYARYEAKRNGLTVYKDINGIPNNIKFDAVIAHHTLEHVDEPYLTLLLLKDHLKTKGFIICVVPIDDWRREKLFKISDINKHLYTWTPQLIGNLFERCGFKIREIKIIGRTWLPLSRYYYKFVPKVIYNFLSALWSSLTLSRQIRIVAVN